jgi:hypothetical protein
VELTAKTLARFARRSPPALYGPLFSRSVMESIDLAETLDIPPQEMTFFEAFYTHDVRYLLIGGTAVRFHGYLRTVDDVDVVVDNARENARRVYDAVTGITGAQPFTVDDLCRPKQKLRPCYYYLDILTSLNGIEF